jgi:Leucine rich repeat
VRQNCLSMLSFSYPVYNGLNGTLPSELHALSNLEELTLVGGGLQSTIPSSSGKLTLLEYLQLGNNLLTGSFPESFSDLDKLEHLYMDYNALTGSIPAFLSIESISVRFNFLSGTIASDDAFENLKYIYLSFNMLSGSIPESFFSPTVQVISLWENNFIGSPSSKVGDLVETSSLDLSYNDLTGFIPSEIGDLSRSLVGLYLDSNRFNGTIPSQMGSLTGLEGLWLSDNQLTGTVPVEFASLKATGIKLFANNLTGSLDMFCNKTFLVTKVEADCGGVEPAVECSCCTSCCEPLTGNCTVITETVCLVEKSYFEDENGPNYYESGGTVCECTTGSDSNNGFATLSCTDTQCQSCNLDGTVCSVNDRYEFDYDENGNPSVIHSTFQYVVGRNDTVTLEWTLKPDLIYQCEVTVNGQLCNACFHSLCHDSFSGIRVDCENVEGAGGVDVCDPMPEDINGPLAVFAFQDSVFLQGCPPRILVE